MPVNQFAIKTAIEAKIESDWGNTTPINFVSTAFDSNDPANKIYIAPRITLQNNEKKAIGRTGFTRVDGVLNCIISSTDKSSGTGDLFQLADQFINIFQDKSLGDIVFLPGFTQPEDEDDNRVFITCQIDFYTDQPGG